MKHNLRDIDDNDDPVPSYEESVEPFTNNPIISAGDTKTPQRPPLQTRLAETRSHRIRSVVAAYIEPLLDAQLLNCIAKNTLILLPSDTLTSLPDLAAKDLTGLPESARNASVVVRLHGTDNQAAFWLQPIVVQQLSSELRHRLAASGHRVEEPLLPERTTSIPQTAATTSSSGTRSSWLKRTFGPGQQTDPTASTSHWKLGWRSEEEEEATKRKLSLDEMRVNAKVNDVSVMTESELGLLLTETVKAIWLEIEVGT